MTTITEEQYGKFDEQGYILVEGILDDDLLRRARDAADRAEAETQDDWNKWKDDPDRFKSYGNGPTAHVIEPILQHDDIFLDILEHPVATRFAREMQGPDTMMIDNAYHVKVAGTRAHTKWHRDAPRWAHEVENFTPEDGAAWDATRRCDTPHFKIKIFYLLDDVDEETGPFSVVPGTHRVEDPPPPVDTLDAMPNLARMTGPAGSAVIWNGRIWHTALDNTDTKARRMLLYNYTHFGMKQYDWCIAKDDYRDRLARERSAWCQQLLGIERAPLN